MKFGFFCVFFFEKLTVGKRSTVLNSQTGIISSKTREKNGVMLVTKYAYFTSIISKGQHSLIASLLVSSR